METAWLEAQQGHPSKPRPKTLCASEVDCEDIVDLTDAAVRKAHDVDAADLACAWEDMASLGLTSPSWTVAARLRAAEAAGVIVPSFAPGASRTSET